MTHRKRILVTGASRGIGLLAAKSLALEGHVVYAGIRNADQQNATRCAELTHWAERRSCALKPIELDVTSDTSVADAVAHAIEDGGLDVLINNAGVMPVGLTEAFTPEDLARCFDVNVLGAMRVTRAVLPHMRHQGAGLLIHVSSNAGRLPIPFFGAYCASKFALEALAEALHHELSGFGIETTILEPGGHATDLIQSPPAPSDEHIAYTYGDRADGPSRAVKMFQDMFAAGGPEVDAQNVADAILQLVEREGERPFRTTVGDHFAIDELNATTLPFQRNLLAALGPIMGVAPEENAAMPPAGP